MRRWRLAARRRRVAGSGLKLDGQVHLGNRVGEVPRDVDGERLERRDVEGVDRGALPGTARGEIDQARQEARERLAAAGRGNEEGVTAHCGKLEQPKLVGVRTPAARGEPAGKQLRQRLPAVLCGPSFQPSLAAFRLTLPSSFTNCVRRLCPYRIAILRCI